MKETFIGLILILIFCFINITELGAIENLGLIGECCINAGYCRETKIVDNIAYVGCQYGLIILDISDNNNPTLVGSYKTPDICHSLEIKNDYALLACRFEGLIVVNISNPSNPYYVSSFEFPITYMQALKIEIQDNYAFISGAFNTPYLYILDIEDIVNPVVVAYDDSNYYRDFTVEENYIYAVNYELCVIDISQISNPTLVSSLDCCNWQPSIELKNEKAFIEDDGALKIVDVSDPNNLNLISVFDDFQTNPYDLVVDDNYAYITGSDEMGFAVININDPLNPYLVQEIDYKGICISKENNIVLISRIVGYQGIGIIDVEDPNNLNIVGEYKTCNAKKLYVNDNYSYVANGCRGLTIIDVSNPSHPAIILEFINDHNVVDVMIDSTIAFLSVSNQNYYRGIQILDISNPLQPNLINTLNLTGGHLAFDKYNNFIYIGGDTGIIKIFDITNLLDPILINQFSVNDWSYDLKIYNNYLFIAGYWGGLQIFDLSDPTNPLEVGYYPLDLALSVEANDDIAFIGDPYTSLRIFDTSNISNPILTETYSVGDVKDMYYLNDELYVASLTGIHIFDVTNPYYTFELNQITDCYPNAVFYKNGYIFCTENFEFKVYGDTTLASVDDYLIIDKRNKCNLSNYPNPFNPSGAGRSPTTTISFALPKDSKVELSVYNIKGQKVKTLLREAFESGNHSIIWNGDDDSGNSVSSGIYFYKLKAGDFQKVKKMILLK